MWIVPTHIANKMVIAAPRPQLALCELYHPRVHGVTAHSSPHLPTHVLCIEVVEPGEIDDAQEMANRAPAPARSRHPAIRAYADVCRHARLFGPQIVHVHELSGGESVVVIRTGGLRRLQRKVRSIVNRG